MDPYVDLRALDPGHPNTRRKQANYARADAAHQAARAVVDALPTKLTLQTTDACNLACPHCQIPTQHKRQRMSTALIERLEEEVLPDLVELHPTNLGEPFAWRGFKSLCAAMHRQGVLLDLTTNGTLLSPDRIAWIAPIARDVKISFDGATAPTFERYRRGASFAQVCEGVRALVQRLRAVRVRRPVVALQMTLMQGNYRELPALIRLGAALGVDRVKAYHLFSFKPELDAESLMNDLDAYEPFRQEAEALGAALGVDVQVAEPALRTPEAHELVPSVCHLPWHETWIDVDGAVLVCHSHNNDLAGHLRDGPLELAWNGPLYQRIRRAFAAGCPTWSCEGCGMTWQRAHEDQAVPYDPGSFLSGRTARSSVRWSGRMRPFDLTGRRTWS